VYSADENGENRRLEGKYTEIIDFAEYLPGGGQGGSQSSVRNNSKTLLTGDDLKTVDNAIKNATEITDPNKRKNCDQALSQTYGIQSLNALVKQYQTTGSAANIFDGRSAQNPPGNSDKVPAWVDSAPLNATTLDPKTATTFVNKRFFNAAGGASFEIERAIVIIHEAVHQFGGLRDSRFGTSQNLTKLLIEKCFPVLKLQGSAILRDVD
jgi:hypothetical protein